MATKSCFVISPIGLVGSETREHADDVFDFIVKPAAEKAGYVPIRADHEARPGTITEQMYDHILGDDLLIAILTGHNPNVFYEVAVAEAAARPLILLIEGNQQVPFDISARRVIQYDLKPRALHTGVHVENLLRSIKELDAGGSGSRRVPFRPQLQPLGGGEAPWRVIPRSRDVSREDSVGLVAEAGKFVWYQGVALFSYVKMIGFDETVRAALARGVEIRILIMHPENPALQEMMRQLTANYIENIRSEIAASAAFWSGFAADGALGVRFHKKGTLAGLLQLSDTRTMFTPYSVARSTAESLTIFAPAATPLYDQMKQDHEWMWRHAETRL